MSKLLTVIVTAITVSLDSLVAGFSLSIGKRRSLTLPAAVSLVTLLLCLITSVSGRFLSQSVQNNLNLPTAALLLLLAVCNLIKKDTDCRQLGEVTLAQSVAVGFAVGTDAAIANLSLALDGMGLVTPIVFAATHFVTVHLGQKLAGKIALHHSEYLSAAILLALAVLKLL